MTINIQPHSINEAKVVTIGIVGGLAALVLFFVFISGGVVRPAEGKVITDSNRVDDIVAKFKSKYGEGDVKKYYTKFDVAVEVLI